MKLLMRTLLAMLFLSSPVSLLAETQEPLLMVRSSKSFNATLDQLSAAITYNEYKVSRIQRVDVGLTKTGFKTGMYRIVFFGKTAEIDALADKHPELVPFIPLKIVIFEEGKETIMLALNPRQLRGLVPNKTLFPYFDRWEKDLRNILEAAKE